MRLCFPIWSSGKSWRDPFVSHSANRAPVCHAHVSLTRGFEMKKNHFRPSESKTTVLQKIVHKILQRWTTKKLRVPHAADYHCGRTQIVKNVSLKCRSSGSTAIVYRCFPLQPSRGASSHSERIELAHPSKKNPGHVPASFEYAHRTFRVSRPANSSSVFWERIRCSHSPSPPRQVRNIVSQFPIDCQRLLLLPWLQRHMAITAVPAPNGGPGSRSEAALQNSLFTNLHIEQSTCPKNRLELIANGVTIQSRHPLFGGRVHHRRHISGLLVCMWQTKVSAQRDPTALEFCWSTISCHGDALPEKKTN